MYFIQRFFLLFTLFVILFTSCKKNDSYLYKSNVKAKLSVEFDNIAGSSDLQLNTGTYTNTSGEIFTVTKLKYYVSNFVFTKTDDTTYTVPQDSSYFLIDESDGTEHEPVLLVPEGEYKAVRFIVGVDSLRSTKDASMRTGVLDTTGAGSDMYRGLNDGYIFFNMEGTSASSADGAFGYHIGGYGGYLSATLNNLKTINLDFTARGIPQVKAGKETNIHLLVDVLKLFDGKTKFSIAEHPMVKLDTYSLIIADNYTTMFRHDHTEN